ncbi:MAG: zinc-binding dehydrogenase, partial [Candidatus Aenigmarchaeota archaeon]|nr:zinc-binding dehydrogenase [Candidatus Aenigmarchaeota archaeon]
MLEVQRVFIADIREQSLDIAESCGLKGIYALSSEVERNGPYDLIVEAAGYAKALHTALKNVEHNGRIVVIGRDTGDLVLPNSLFEQFMRKEALIQGCWGYSIREERKLVSDVLRRNL